MRFRAFYGHLGAALTAVAAYHVFWRELTYRLADETMVFADAAGFGELAAEHPWGAVDWFVRILAATDLTWWGILVQLALVASASILAYFALRHRGSALAPFVPWLAAALFILPQLSLGEEIWNLRHPHFVQMHFVWFMILSLSLFAGWKGLLGFVAIPFVLILIARFAYYDLPVDETLWSAWCLPISQSWDNSSLLAVLVLFALALATAPLCRRAAELPRWIHALPPALFVVGFVFALPDRDIRDQLQMERAVLDSRFAEVLEISPNKSDPSRMESAWRILAMFRTDRLDRDLWRYPFSVSHHDCEEPMMLMGGPLLLFHYGLVVPARRWVFEISSTVGNHPRQFRLLGDIALVMYEAELARRYYEAFARCPFRGTFAARRLTVLDQENPSEESFADLRDVAGMSEVWNSFSNAAKDSRFYPKDVNVERFVYSYFQRLDTVPPGMLKMVFAAALLDGNPKRLKENRAAFGQLYPDGRIGPVFLEALK